MSEEKKKIPRRRFVRSMAGIMVGTAVAAYGIDGCVDDYRAKQKEHRKKLSEELYKAVRYDRLEDIKRLLKAGAVADSMGYYTDSVVRYYEEKTLGLAIFIGNPEAVRLLLKHGAKQDNVRPKDGASSFHILIQRYMKAHLLEDTTVEILEQLLRAKGDINLKNKKGQTALDQLLETAQKEYMSDIEDPPYFTDIYDIDYNLEYIGKAVKLADLMEQKGAKVSRASRKLLEELRHYEVPKEIADKYGYTPPQSEVAEPDIKTSEKTTERGAGN